MYGPNQGRDAILDALSENGVSAMIGADILVELILNIIHRWNTLIILYLII